MYLRVLNENSKPSLIDQPRYQLLVSRLHGAGQRPLGEFIVELHRLRPELPVMDLLERYASIDVAALRRMGADRWPPVVFAVPDGIRSGRANRDAILRRSLPPTDGGDAA